MVAVRDGRFEAKGIDTQSFPVIGTVAEELREELGDMPVKNRRKGAEEAEQLPAKGIIPRRVRGTARGCAGFRGVSPRVALGDRRGAACGYLLESWQRVLPAGTNLGEPGEVVDADRSVVQRRGGHAERSREVIRDVEHAVAQPYHLRACGLVDGPAHWRHGVAVVEEQGVWRQIED